MGLRENSNQKCKKLQTSKVGFISKNQTAKKTRQIFTKVTRRFEKLLEKKHDEMDTYFPT